MEGDPMLMETSAAHSAAADVELTRLGFTSDSGKGNGGLKYGHVEVLKKPLNYAKAMRTEPKETNLSKVGPSNSKGVEGGKSKGIVEGSNAGTDVSKTISEVAEVMVDVSDQQQGPQASKPFVTSGKVKEKTCDKVNKQKDKGMEPTNGPPLLVSSMVNALCVYNKPRRGPVIQTPRSENRFSLLSSDESSDADQEEDISQESVQHLGDGPIPVFGNNNGSTKSGT
ncbi:hypothetical protein L6452_44741 [Arctium lappa]|nr:hypothetical protein L6452_44741 [Arctium lappa]